MANNRSCHRLTFSANSLLVLKTVVQILALKPFSLLYAIAMWDLLLLTHASYNAAYIMCFSHGRARLSQLYKQPIVSWNQRMNWQKTLATRTS